MGYYEIMDRMKSNLIDPKQFNNGNEIDGNPQIAETICDYCGAKIYAVWDDNNKKNWWPYLGNQVRKPNSYKYSPIINAMRSYYNVEGTVWTEELGNNLLNVHARCHSEPTNWSKRCSDASIRLLCNKCFQKTYQRTKIQGNDGITYAISVLPERGETIESVMKDLGITGKVLGKGGIIDYD